MGPGTERDCDETMTNQANQVSRGSLRLGPGHIHSFAAKAHNVELAASGHIVQHLSLSSHKNDFSVCPDCIFSDAHLLSYRPLKRYTGNFAS